ncbi:ABC transporter ATP-binding protein [Sanguibacter suarezii]|uniref:ABC transporter ATP-binding protein n=1 Tax=Sanguibacter suarezii TaxID=60921 RepID=UPI000A00ABD9|nr:ABC transporter ATP-binding protein [Sanguibacter suarezii]
MGSAGQAIRRTVHRRSARWIALIRLLPTAGAGIVIGGLAMGVLLALAPLAVIVLMGRVLYLLPDAAAAATWDELLTTLLVAFALLVVQQLAVPFQEGIVEVIGRRVDQHCIDRLMGAALADAPLSVLEEPEALDILADARAAYSRLARTPGEAAGALIPLTSRYIQLVGAVVLVAVVVSPVAAAVIAATALVVRFAIRGTLGRFAVLWDSLSGSRRKMSYLREVATGAKAAKEIRLLGLLPWLRARLRHDTMANFEPQWRGSRKLQLWPFVGYSMVGLVGGAVVLVIIAVAGTAGNLNLFQLGVALQAVLIPMRFGVYFPECDVQTQYGLHSFEALERFEELVSVAQTAGPGEAVSGAAAPGVASTGRAESENGEGGVGQDAASLRGVVRFERVSFRYADGGPWVLRDLDLELAPGGSTAIVGLNGAGKTTLVKLLARLYDPTRGRITVGGVDLREVDASEWQRQLALIFQDYVRYELTAGENIGFGAPHLMDDRAAVRSAAERAGADVVLDQLPDGLDTPLSARYPGGRDLSGGQWQRIALARALLAVQGGASVLVLDEPTAQLDVRAEAEFFDRFLATMDGLTSVVISHRFSTVRRADQIVVIEHGRVIERGTHDQLIELGGRYAELFELQSSRFRTPTTDTSAVTGSTNPEQEISA